MLDGETGVLFGEQGVDGLVAAIERFEALELDPAAVRENAVRFGKDRFRAEMANVIERALTRRPTGSTRKE